MLQTITNGICLPNNQNVRTEVRLSDFDIDNGAIV